MRKRASAAKPEARARPSDRLLHELGGRLIERGPSDAKRLSADRSELRTDVNSAKPRQT